LKVVYQYIFVALFKKKSLWQSYQSLCRVHGLAFSVESLELQIIAIGKTEKLLLFLSTL
jgi:hypothetical protein